MIKQLFIKIKRTLFIYGLVCLISDSLLAQPASAVFRNLTPADGLPSTAINSVTQDAFGFIWIGSWNSVYRYDGYTFRKIPETNNGRYVNADKKGGVWISFSTSVAYYNPYTESLRKYNISHSNRFPDLVIDDAGNVWVTSDDGVMKLDTVSHIFIKDNGQQSGNIRNLTAWQDGELLFKYGNPTDSTQFIGHRDNKGIYSYEPFPADLNNPVKGHAFCASFNSVIKMDSTGILLVNDFGWAYKSQNLSNWKFKKLLNNEAIGNAINIKLDKKGNMWLNQVNALTKINILTGEKIVYRHDPANPKSILPFKNNFTTCNLFFDRQGVLWITRFAQGISRLNLFENDFGLLKDSSGAPFLDVLSAIELNDGSYWIGYRTDKNGLIHFGADGKIIKTYGSKSFDSPPGRTVSNELSNPYPQLLVVTADGSVWVGTGSIGRQRGGVNRIKPGSNLITRFKYDPADKTSIPGDYISRMLVDGSDRVWILTEQGIAYIVPATEQVTRGLKMHLSDTAGELNYVPEFISSQGDLVVVNLSFKHFIVDHKTLSVKPFADNITTINSMRFVHRDKLDRIWFVCPEGFGYLDTPYTAVGKFYEIEKLGVPFNNIPEMINSDKDGNIWMATDNGIIKFDPLTAQFIHFGIERGLQGNFFDQLNYKGPSGKIYFGDNGGINIFDPASIQSNPYPPQMIFTALKLDGKSITFGEKSAIQKPIFVSDKITVGSEVLTISLDFAAIHFAGDHANQFQYRLDGFDNNWRAGGTIGNATYTNLSPGYYTLYIKGSNWDGVWSDGKKSIVIIFLPPWWRTWWAYSLYGLLFIFFSWQFFKYQQIKTIRKERERTQVRELQQAKEIEKAYTELKSTQAQLIQSEKMASLGELTAGIAHEIQNPLNFVNNFSDLNSELIKELKNEVINKNLDEISSIASDIASNSEKINHHGKRAETIVKGMLEHSRKSSGIKEHTDINKLCDEFIRLSYHGLRAKNKDFNCDYKLDLDPDLPLVNVVSQDIGRVILNIINNAFQACSEKNRDTQNLAGSSGTQANSNLQGYQPQVSITTKFVPKGTSASLRRCEICISDNGPGIPDSIKDKIFQPFFTTKPTGQGTGLGLSLVYDIVKAHGGTIQVHSDIDQGTEFMIQLPA